MDQTQQVPAVAKEIKESGPVPMSFPAILRNPGLSDRFAHLHLHAKPAVSSTAVSNKQNRRDDKEGKRWVRRKENARFVGNVHIIAPSKMDYNIPLPSSRTTFPEPLPNFLSRNNTIPAAVPGTREPNSANSGRFSLSLKGMRRELRRGGPRTELLVKEVEDEILAWISAGGIMLSPDSATALEFPGEPIGTSNAIREVSRTPLQLVWSISDDPYTRYIVHCCARYHDVVSFSKDTSGQRLTYLLRPNVTRPPHYATPPLDTPPITDLSELSANDVDTESDRDMSDVDGPVPARGLTAIVEVGTDTSAPPSPPTGPVYVAAVAVPSDDEWSVLGESDMESSHEGDLVRSVASLALSDAADGDVDVERLAAVRRRQGPDALRSRLLERQRRSASSPSRSPARRTPPRPKQRVELRAKRLQSSRGKSFYEYLFA